MNWWLFLAVCGFCLFLAYCSRVDHSAAGWWFYRRGMSRLASDDQAATDLRRVTQSSGLWQAVQPWYGGRGVSAITRDGSGRTWELSQHGWRAPHQQNRSAVIAGKLLGAGYPSDAVARCMDRYQDYLPDTQREQLAAHLDRDVP